MRLKLGTLNCQNNLDNRLDRNSNSSILANHILEEDYNVLGTQELTINFTNKLMDNLNGYNIYGSYQYGKGIIGTKLPLIKEYNQSNQIITNMEVIHTNTCIMPWIPRNISDIIKGIKKKSITKRLITNIDILYNDNHIFVFNTHLDYYIKSVQKSQLKYILRKIKRYRKYGDVVLMGDFNLALDNDLFEWFIGELANINIKRVPVDEKTNHKKYSAKSAIDHIFIPSDWNIINCGTISPCDLNDITDHKAVYVEVDID